MKVDVIDSAVPTDWLDLPHETAVGDSLPITNLEWTNDDQIIGVRRREGSGQLVVWRGAELNPPASWGGGEFLRIERLAGFDGARAVVCTDSDLLAVEQERVLPLARLTGRVAHLAMSFGCTIVAWSEAQDRSRVHVLDLGTARRLEYRIEGRCFGLAWSREDDLGVASIRETDSESARLEVIPAAHPRHRVTVFLPWPVRAIAAGGQGGSFLLAVGGPQTAGRGLWTVHWSDDPTVSRLSGEDPTTTIRATATAQFFSVEGLGPFGGAIALATGTVCVIGRLAVSCRDIAISPDGLTALFPGIVSGGVLRADVRPLWDKAAAAAGGQRAIWRLPTRGQHLLEM